MSRHALSLKLVMATLVLLLASLCPAQTTAPRSELFDAPLLLQDVKMLSADDMQGRATGAPGGARAREFVRKRFKESGLAQLGDTFLQPFKVGELTGVNIYGYIKGTKTPDKYIVVSAHYDHVGVRNKEIYNGADDNASGTAALFAMIAYFKTRPPANSLLFVAFDGEEMGLLGSRHFVSKPPVPQKSILLNVNMDMISHNDRNELYASGTYHYPALKQYLAPVIAQAKVKLLLGHDRPEQLRDDWTNQSDQASFHRAKIPFVYFGVEDHQDYHKPTDDFANINQRFYINAVEVIMESVKALDKGFSK
jgi:Zn-dependent M28 family amino/carboxypeptidase